MFRQTRLIHNFIHNNLFNDPQVLDMLRRQELADLNALNELNVSILFALMSYIDGESLVPSQTPTWQRQPNSDSSGLFRILLAQNAKVVGEKHIRITPDSTWSALHFAAAYGWVKSMSYLLGLTDLVDVNTKDSLGRTPLYVAVECLQEEVVKVLVANGARPHDSEIIDFQMNAPMDSNIIACLEIQQSTSYPVHGGPLHLALGHIQQRAKGSNTFVKTKICKMFQYLLESVEDNAEWQLWAKQALIPTLQSGTPELIEFLVTICDDDCIYPKDTNGCNALHWTAINFRDGVMDLVLPKFFSHGLVDKRDKFGWTPLHYACLNGNQFLMDLVRAGADIQTPLKHARTLDYNIHVEAGTTPLHIVCSRNDRQFSAAIVERLIAIGADIESRDVQGETPLFKACLSGSLLAIKILLKAGADPNTTRNDRCTPLHHLVSMHAVERVKLLVDAGADCYVADQRGKRPVDFASVPESVEKLAWSWPSEVGYVLKEFATVLPRNLKRD